MPLGDAGNDRAGISLDEMNLFAAVYQYAFQVDDQAGRAGLHRKPGSAGAIGVHSDFSAVRARNNLAAKTCRVGASNIAREVLLKGSHRSDRSGIGADDTALNDRGITASRRAQ